jgi:hypothetical protein
MSKKLLSETQVRRFAKLANLSPINEMDYKRDDDLEEAYGGNKGDESRSKRDYMEEEAPYGGNKGDESRSKRDYMKEDADEEIAMDAADAGAGDLPEPDEAALDDMAGEDGIEMEESGLTPEQAQDLTGQLVDAIAVVMGVDVEVSDDEPEMVDMEDEMDIDTPEGDIEVSDDEEMNLQEALGGINYVPGKKEIVNEVAKRVAKRLLKAKQAEAQLQEALGSKQRSRRRKK